MQVSKFKMSGYIWIAMKSLKGVQRPAAFAIVCLYFCEFRTVKYSGSCGEQVVDFPQSMLVFVLSLTDTLGLPENFFD